ncbi:hypothetical protein QJQ45_029898 [Haematococcus lacustris]|nr:hypothetical protein QJQ45_029898 [Haematococcus lacustris]
MLMCVIAKYTPPVVLRVPPAPECCSRYGCRIRPWQANPRASQAILLPNVHQRSTASIPPGDGEYVVPAQKLVEPGVAGGAVRHGCPLHARAHMFLSLCIRSLPRCCTRQAGSHTTRCARGNQLQQQPWQPVPHPAPYAVPFDMRLQHRNPTARLAQRANTQPQWERTRKAFLSTYRQLALQVRTENSIRKAPDSTNGSPTDLDLFLRAATCGANLVPLVQRLFSDQLTPVMAYRCLAREGEQAAPSFLLESVVNGDQQGRYSFVGAMPALEVVATQNQVVVLDHERGSRQVSTEADPMQVPEALSRNWRPALLEGVPAVFTGGWVGYAGYDTVRYVYSGKLQWRAGQGASGKRQRGDSQSLQGAKQGAGRGQVRGRQGAGRGQEDRSLHHTMAAFAGKLPFDTAPVDDRNLPDMHLSLYNEVVVFDQATKIVYAISWVHLQEASPFPVAAVARAAAPVLLAQDIASEDSLRAAYHSGATRLRHLAGLLTSPPPAMSSGQVGLSLGQRPASPGKSNVTKEEFLAAVQETKEHIAAGDIFQLVLSQRFERRTFAEPFEVYRALRVVNPSPYMVYMQARGCIIVSSSPEILCRVDGRRTVTNRPLAGTRRRGATQEEDLALEKELLADGKECAEHVMLVDLGRNDVGKVAVNGSVVVEKLMEVERYSHVMHISSTVTGTLLPHLDAWDALRAALPAGTVSGAPKVVRDTPLTHPSHPSHTPHTPHTPLTHLHTPHTPGPGPAPSPLPWLGWAGWANFSKAVSAAVQTMSTHDGVGHDTHQNGYDGVDHALPAAPVVMVMVAVVVMELTTLCLLPLSSCQVRAMQIIDELEVHRRGPYGGGIGHVSFTGSMDMALGLRTMVVPTAGNDTMYMYRRGEASATEHTRREWVMHLQAGAGLVADSQPESEYEETVNKAAALGRAIDLAEAAFVTRSDPSQQ